MNWLTIFGLGLGHSTSFAETSGTGAQFGFVGTDAKDNFAVITVPKGWTKEQARNFGGARALLHSGLLLTPIGASATEFNSPNLAIRSQSLEVPSASAKTSETLLNLVVAEVRKTYADLKVEPHGLARASDGSTFTLYKLTSLTGGYYRVIAMPDPNWDFKSACDSHSGSRKCDESKKSGYFIVAVAGSGDALTEMEERLKSSISGFRRLDSNAYSAYHPLLKCDELDDDSATYKCWDQMCELQASKPLLAQDLPSAAQLLTLSPKCDAEGLLYGIGVPADPVQALHCAYKERESKNSGFFSGAGLLMTIYANGIGVNRNIELAERFACEIKDKVAGSSHGFQDLEEAKLDPKKLDDFTACSYNTSGYGAGICARHQERIESAKRSESLVKLTSKWSSADREKFKLLRKAAAAFGSARAENEIDQSGTMRGAFVEQELSIQELDFEQSLEKLEKGKAPHYSLEESKAADQKLNSLWQKIKTKQATKKDDDDNWGTVKYEGLLDAQRAWLAYRDAWVAFAKIKYPSTDPDSIRAWFTKKRNHMLSRFE